MNPKKNRLFTMFAATCLILGLGLSQQGDINAATLASGVEVKVRGVLTSDLDLVDVSAPLVQQTILQFSNGVGANQANVIWSDRRTLTASTTEDLDFAAGGLVDALGVAVAPAKIRAVFISSSSLNVQNITLFGDAASIPFLGTAATTVTLKPGGIYLQVAPDVGGIAVTAGTGDIIQVANGAGVSVTYDIIVLGTSS